MNVGLDQYNVPTNIRSAVNHGLNAAAAGSGSITKDVARIRFV